MEIFDKSQMSLSLLYYTKIVFPPEALSQKFCSADLHLESGSLEWPKRLVEDNQWILMFTLFATGYFGVSATQYGLHHWFKC